MPPDAMSIGAAIRAAAQRLAGSSETPRLDAELLMAHALGVSREALLLGGLDRPFAAPAPSATSATPSSPFVMSEVEARDAGVALGACPSTGSGRTEEGRGFASRPSTALRTNGGVGGLGTNAAEASFASLLARRLGGEPLAYITGHRAFWTIELGVAPGVLIPRPDSETLIEAAVDHFAGTAGPRRILDLGTGSGALLLAALAEWPQATGVGIDRSAAALAIARANAAALGMADRAAMVEGGWSGTGDKFDLILCNPPYIGTGEPLPRDVAEHEPPSALFAGPDGLDEYRALAPLLPAQIAEGGIACIEIGATQGLAVSALLEAAGLVVQIRHDLAGRDRCIAAKR